MLSELSSGNKQRMNTIKHELKQKLKEIEIQRKRTMEDIDNETKLLSIELAQSKSQTASYSEQTTLLQSSVSYLPPNQQLMSNRFKRRIPVSRSRDECLPYGRSNSDLVHTSSAMDAEALAYYSHNAETGKDGNKFCPKRVNQYTNEYRRKVSELNASRLHGDGGCLGKATLPTPGLNQYLRVHPSVLNANKGAASESRPSRNVRRSSESHPVTPGVVYSRDGASPNGDEYGSHWVTIVLKLGELDVQMVCLM